MKRHVILIPLAIAILGFVFLLLWAVRARQSIPLANDYRLYFHDAGPVIILDTNAEGFDRTRVYKIIQRKGIWTVGPCVDGYRVYRQIIVGHVSKIPGDSPHFSLARDPEECAPGYFVIDANTDKIYNGLNKGEWLAKLDTFRVDSEPELIKPTVWHRLMRPK